MRAAAWALASTLVATAASAGPVDEVSAWREAAGLPKVARDRSLDAEANRHARDMAESSRLTHGDFGARMKAIGRSSGAVENLASGMDGFRRVMALWEASPGHAANLLRVDMRKAGVGSAVDARGRRFWSLILSR